MKILCWSEEHKAIIYFAGIPIIIVWIIGFPVFIFYKLFKQRKNLNDKDTIAYFGLFFIGLNDKSYYWEIAASNIRKIVFILGSSVLSTANATQKSLSVVAIIIAQTYFLKNSQPYIDARFNSIEFLSQYAAALTLYAGAFFVQQEVQQNNQILYFLFLFVLSYNIYFLAVWIKTFIVIMMRVHLPFFKTLNICRCLKKINVWSYEKDLKVYEMFVLAKRNPLYIDGKIELSSEYEERKDYERVLNQYRVVDRSSAELSNQNSPRFALPQLQHRASRYLRFTSILDKVQNEREFHRVMSKSRPKIVIPRLKLDFIQYPSFQQRKGSAAMNSIMINSRSDAARVESSELSKIFQNQSLKAPKEFGNIKSDIKKQRSNDVKKHKRNQLSPAEQKKQRSVRFSNQGLKEQNEQPISF